MKWKVNDPFVHRTLTKRQQQQQIMGSLFDSVQKNAMWCFTSLYLFIYFVLALFMFLLNS